VPFPGRQVDLDRDRFLGKGEEQEEFRLGAPVVNHQQMRAGHRRDVELGFLHVVQCGGVASNPKELLVKPEEGPVRFAALVLWL
jgi:hypothetical protein